LVASPFFVFAARDARMYSLALLLTTASTYFFLRLVDSDGERADRWWIAYAVVSTAAVYSHLFCVFVVLAHGVSMVALPRRSVPLRRLVRAWVTVGVLLTPLGYYIARHRASNVDWVGPLSIDQVGEYADLLVGSRLNTVVAAVVVCVCAAVVARVALSSGRSRALWLLCVGGALLVVPVVAALTVSVAKPLFVDRYLIVTVPGFALVVGAVIDRMRRQRLVITIAVVLVIGALSYRSIDRAVAPAPKEDWRAAAAFVGARIQPGDAIVVGPDAFYGFGHYAARDPRLADVESEWPGGPWAVRWIRSDDRDLSSRVPTSARTWVVVRGDPDALQEGWRPPPLERFRTHVAGGDIELVVRFENVSVFRYEPDGAG
jgi:hypothetical protein